MGLLFSSRPVYQLLSCPIQSHLLLPNMLNCPNRHIPIFDRICLQFLNFLNFVNCHCWCFLHRVMLEWIKAHSRRVGLFHHFEYQYQCCCSLWRSFLVRYSYLSKCQTPLTILHIDVGHLVYLSKHDSALHHDPLDRKCNKMLGVVHICNEPSTCHLQYPLH